MQFNQDVFGQHLLAFHNGKISPQIIERDDHFIGISHDTKTYFSTIENWPMHEQHAIKLANGKVLDIGAGAGRVGLFLQRTGIDVTSIDNSALAVEVCSQRGLLNIAMMSSEDISCFAPDSFDSIVLFGDNFGIFESASKAKHLLEVLYKITTASAVMLAESTNIFETDEAVHLDYYQKNKVNRRMPGQLRLRLRHQQFIGQWFDWLMVDPKQMQALLEETGWKMSRIFGSHRSQFVAVIEKI